MTSQNVLELQQPTPGATLPGCWKLDAGRAVTLQPREAGVLRVAHGRMWATLQGPHRGRGNDLGDHFLSPGQQLALQPGQRLVIESWDPAGPAPAWFSWDPAADPMGVMAGRRSPLRQGRRWQAAVVQPLGDLGVALGMAARAAGRLVLGLAGLAGYLVAGRSRVMSQLESRQP